MHILEKKKIIEVSFENMGTMYLMILIKKNNKIKIE
jgi:hypothetical protein